ncbi:DUF4435 domain-containing protein [Chryseobacterium sp. W4I1]|uniref:DUF4435 domain-containing protein n=1 Tax=Chryseobacterium sp. W4I1 TaxID=3042293 RepID=UPI002789DF7B|nr:DUF4435 domain-containing protein [Chryseobacterium sp. W4I1]MDQ0782230.1 hypothetical protein [Chryseobacterium sp. W4I1]
MNKFLPILSDSFLRGQNILYRQFNDVEFYIEDTEQENLYYHILKNLFSDVKFEKIFPLNGKKNVKDDCILNIGNKNKVYIVDKDFDDILNKTELYDNLFYLKGYSIENLLISKKSFYELIKEKSPKLKDNDIDLLYSHTSVLNNILCLKELAIIFIIIQKFELGEQYYNINTSRDFNINTDFSYKGSFIPDYISDIEYKLRLGDRRLTLKGQAKKYKRYFRNTDDVIRNVPGKHLLIIINDLLKSKNLIMQYSLESLTYKLAKEVDISNFTELKTNIEHYINN